MDSRIYADDRKFNVDKIIDPQRPKSFLRNSRMRLMSS